MYGNSGTPSQRSMSSSRRDSLNAKRQAELEERQALNDEKAVEGLVERLVEAIGQLMDYEAKRELIATLQRKRDYTTLAELCPPPRKFRQTMSSTENDAEGPPSGEEEKTSSGS